MTTTTDPVIIETAGMRMNITEAGCYEIAKNIDQQAIADKLSRV